MTGDWFQTARGSGRCGPGPRVLRAAAGAWGRVGALTVAAVLLAAGLCGCSGGRGPEFYVNELGSADQERRERAVDELIRMQEEALPYLEETLRTSSNTAIVTGVIGVLANPRGNRSQESLEAVGSKTKDVSPEVRLAAIKGVADLAEVRKRTGTQLLRAAMEDEDPKCIRAAAEGLAGLNFEDATACLEEFFNSGEGIQAVFAAEALYSLEPTASASFLLVGISSPNEDVRTAAQEVAAGLADKFVPDLVQYTLDHPGAEEPEVVLGRIREALCNELDKNLTAERSGQIMAALGMIADRPSIEKLLGVTTDTRQHMSARLAAAEGLGEAAASLRAARLDPGLRGEVISSLRRLVREEVKDPRVAIGYAISLCRLRERDGAEYLLRQLGDLDKTERKEAPTEEDALALTELRIQAQEALTMSGDFVVPLLIEAIEDPGAGDIMCWAGASTLGDLRAKEAVAPLGALVTETVAALGTLLPRRGDPAERFPLKDAERDSEQAGAAAVSKAPLVRLAWLSLLFGSLVSLVVILAFLALLFKISNRSRIAWKPAMTGGVCIVLASILVGLVYSRLVKSSFDWTAGASAKVFEPTRQVVLAHVFGGEKIVPSRDMAVRIAAVGALGRIGDSEATDLLNSARELHERVREGLQAFIDSDAGKELVPSNLAREEDKGKVRELIDELALRMLREQEAVLFYVRQALKQSSQARPLRP